MHGSGRSTSLAIAGKTRVASRGLTKLLPIQVVWTLLCLASGDEIRVDLVSVWSGIGAFAGAVVGGDVMIVAFRFWRLHVAPTRDRECNRSGQSVTSGRLPGLSNPVW